MNSHRVLIEGELESVRVGKGGHPHSPTLLVLNEKNRRHIIRRWISIGQREIEELKKK